MTIELFMILFTIGSAASSLLTEAMKKLCVKWASPNIIALMDAIIVGLFGTCAAYILMGVTYTPQNIICIILMTICIWIGSMIGYDKITQTLGQLRR